MNPSLLYTTIVANTSKSATQPSTQLLITPSEPLAETATVVDKSIGEFSMKMTSFGSLL